LFVELKQRIRKQRWFRKQCERWVWQQWQCGERFVDYLDKRWQLCGFLRAGHQLWPRRWRRNGCCTRTRFDF
jgi:hypothetical protein